MVRRVRCGRRAISTLIAGTIVLILLLTALGTMVFITQQYDAYQSILSAMSQEDAERFSESIAPVPPGLAVSNQPVLCGGASCNQYIMTLSNNGPIEVQITRIYINSTSVCTVFENFCIFDPSNITAPFTFQRSAALIEPTDSSHTVAFWLPSNLHLPGGIDANTISLVTSRGRVFTFQWMSPVGVAIPSELRLDVGPLRIIYDYNFVTFTRTTAPYDVPGTVGCANWYPSPTPCYSPGWYSPFPSGMVTFYVRISNIGGAPVTLLDGSYVLAEGLSGDQIDLEQFYIVTPMSQPCHDNYFASSDFEIKYWPPGGPSTCPTPSTIQGYNASYLAGQCNWSNPCYQLDNATLGVPGKQTYVLFSAQVPKGISASALKTSYNYFLYLELSYVYLGYEYSISVPLIAVNT
jgi:hypothetical protein